MALALRRSLWAILFALTAFGAAPNPREIKFEAIKFKDLTAGLTVQLKWSWHAIGIDPSEIVYVVFGGPDGESADCALFQYREKSGSGG